MSDYKPASEGQRNYIRKLVRERAKDLSAIPHLVGQGDERVDQLSFEEAKTVLRYLTELPEPPPEVVEAITDQQRSKIWAQLKAAGHNTYKVWLLKKDDADIPHLEFDTIDDGVWDWLSELSKSQASDVIRHLGG